MLFVVSINYPFCGPQHITLREWEREREREREIAIDNVGTRQMTED